MTILDGPSSLQPRSHRVIALVVAFALLMQQLDATVLTIALPAMARDLKVPVTQLSMALTAYLVALAAFIPASGRLADRFGSRTVFCAAIATFGLASVACAQSNSAAMLVVARVVQGMGGAMMVPVGRLVLLRSVPREQLVDALSWLVMPALIGSIMGPPIGGLIVTYLDWRWIFYLNVPVGAIGLLLALPLIPQMRAATRPTFDVAGFVLSGAALACIVFGLELVNRASSSVMVAGLLVCGMGFTAAYVRHARATEDPILDLSLMRISTFRVAVTAGTLSRITQGAQPFLLPLLFQLGFGLSAAQTGAITMAGAVGALVMKPIAPMAIRRFGYRRSLTIGSILAGATCALSALFRPDWPVWAMFAILAASGFFMSLLFTGYNAVAFVHVSADRTSAATSLYATVQQLGLSLGICLASAIVRAERMLPQAVPPLQSFSTALFIVSMLAIGAAFANARLPGGRDQQR